MKRCPTCNQTYTDPSLNFCLEDGTALMSVAPAGIDPNATIRSPGARNTGDPPPTEIYRQPGPPVNRVPEMQAPNQWLPVPEPKKKSSAIWWVLGGFAFLAIIGIGLLVMIFAVASLSTDNNSNSTVNSNTTERPRNINISSNSNRSTNTNASTLPSSLADDFSERKWGTGDSKFGQIWYADEQYHMRSKEKTFLVMYAPHDDYNTENATVEVTTRSVSGDSPTSGYGLIVHGEKKNNNELEDYGLLIFTGDQPQYEIVMHKEGNQKALVPWTKSSVIRGGTNPNRLEVRIKGNELSFYINGQYIDRITDEENFKRGLVGLYTSDTAEVVFDDLEIRR